VKTTHTRDGTNEDSTMHKRKRETKRGRGGNLAAEGELRVYSMTQKNRAGSVDTN